MDKFNQDGLKKRIVKNAQFFLTVTPPFPKNILMELNNGCNHKCTFCTNYKMTRPLNQINKKLAYKLLEESYLLGAREIGFYTTGEPLINKNLHLYIKKAKDVGFDYVYITTNGALATPSRIKPIIDADLDSVKFSINAGTKKTYKLIHGKDDFELVLGNLKWLSEYVSEKCKLYVSYIITEENKHEITILKNRIDPYIDGFTSNPVYNRLHISKNENALSMPIPCSMLFNRLHITCEGYLTVCCIDFQNYLVVANLNKSSLAESWNNELFVETRERHLNNELDETLCDMCTSDGNKEIKIKPLLPQYATLITE